MNRTLYMQVLDYDRFSRDDPIGEVCIPISEIDLSTSQTLWRNLQPCKGHSVSNAARLIAVSDFYCSSLLLDTASIGDSK